MLHYINVISQSMLFTVVTATREIVVKCGKNVSESRKRPSTRRVCRNARKLVLLSSYIFDWLRFFWLKRRDEEKWRYYFISLIKLSKRKDRVKTEELRSGLTHFSYEKITFRNKSIRNRKGKNEQPMNEIWLKFKTF